MDVVLENATTNRTVTRPLLLWACLALVSVPGLRAAQQAEEIVWPLPPEPAVIRYAGAVYSEKDVGKKRSFFGRITSSILGSADGGVVVQRPHDVHVDAEGRIFLSNGLEAGFWVFDPVEKEGRLVNPTGLARVQKPMGIGGDRDGTVYLADGSGQRVVAVTRGGEFVAAYGGSQTLLNPVDVAVSPSGDRIYVADSYLHQLIIFSRDGEVLRRVGRDEGDLTAMRQRRWERVHGAPGAAVADSNAPGDAHTSADGPSDMYENRSAAPGEFRYPAFVTTGPDGTVYVTDQLNFRVQAFDADGNYLTHFGHLGDGPGTFARPKGVAVDSDGHVYVVDAAFNNVQIFNPTGQLLLSFGGFGNREGQLWLPLGIAIDPDNRIYVVDRYNNRVQVFEYLGEPEAVETPSEQF